MRAATTRSGVVDDVDVGRVHTTTLFGFDATVRWRPLRRSIYRLVPRPLRGGLEPARAAGRPAATASGFYVSGDYQFARRWFAGVRFDRSDRADDASLLDIGRSRCC